MPELDYMNYLTLKKENRRLTRRIQNLKSLARLFAVMIAVTTLMAMCLPQTVPFWALILASVITAIISWFVYEIQK